MPTIVAEHAVYRQKRKRPLILLIEDNVTQLDLYAMVLEREFDVVTATRGGDGYELAAIEQPDAIVVDVVLPDVDGLSVCEQLRANAATASIPVVVLTGDDAALARAKTMQSHMHAVLAKPCPADRLISVLRAAIESSAD